MNLAESFVRSGLNAFSKSDLLRRTSWYKVRPESLTVAGCCVRLILPSELLVIQITNRSLDLDGVARMLSRRAFTR